MSQGNPQEVDQCSTLVDVLRLRATVQGSQLAYRFLSTGDADGEIDEWTYAQLDFRARAIGSTLQAEKAWGERVLLLYPPGLDFIAAFMGCLYAGAIAVPTYPPDPARLSRTLPRLRAIAQDSGTRFVLTTTPILEMAEFLLPEAPELGALRWLASDTPSEELAGAWRPPDITGDTLAFLQYTSGSTGTPKGVMVSHTNVLHNERQVRASFEHDAGSDFVGWLPLFHDMGLIGNVLQPLYLGSRCTLMSPVSFLQRPMRWMEAISRYRARTSGGPNFAYDLCARRATDQDRASLDLSSWTVAFNGAEPIREDTLERFVQAFAPAGFRREALYPCYGLAEATLLVSGALKSEPPVYKMVEGTSLERYAVEAASQEQNARCLVSSGRGTIEQRLLIVDPETRLACPPGRVGEIWVSGANVARGYWNRPEETERTFGARLADSGEGPFLRTGDLGFLDDTELYVAGRIKDLIILRGRNIYPQDVELVVEQVHPRLRQGCCAAFSLEMDGEERLAVAVEMEPRGAPVEPPELVAAIRRAVAEQFGVHAHVVLLLKARTIPKTSSGKIQRHACRLGFLQGSLELVERSVQETPVLDDSASKTGGEALSPREALRVASAEERPRILERFVLAEVARALRVDPSRLDGEASLASVGLDSLQFIDMHGRLEGALGLRLPSAFLWQHPTLASLAEGLRVLWEAGDSAATPGSTPLVAGPIEGEQPLSVGQHRLWFLNQLVPGTALYNLQFGLRLTGQLDTAALERGLQALVRRHASLRTVFLEVEGEPRQRILPELMLPMPKVDRLGLSREAREAEVRHLALALGGEPFDLARGPLMRARLVSFDRDDHVLLIAQHHIVTDGWSISVLAGELASFYRSFSTGGALALAEPALSYVDYARWESSRAGSLDGQREFWKQELAGLPRLELPTDRAHSGSISHRGATLPVSVPRPLVEKLKALGRREGCTPFVLLLAAYETLLHRYSGQDDFGVGTIVANRERPETRGLVGFFANTLVVRCDLSGDPTFQELLHRVRARAARAFANADLSFDEVVEAAQAARDGNRNPLFRTSFVLESPPTRNTEIPGMVWSPVVWPPDGAIEGTSKFDLSLAMAETPEGFIGALEYSTDLFEPGTVERMAGHLLVLLRGIAENPSRRLSELPLLTEAERHRLLVEWNDTAADFPRESCFHSIFEARAARTPDAVAALFRQQQLTYGELNRRANRLAWQLRASGVGQDVVVAVLLERGIDFLTTLLAIFKAGGAYLPLDPGHPAQRHQQVLEQSGVHLAVCSAGFAAVLEARLPRVLRVEALLAHEGAEHDLPPVSTPDSLAYVIYTSGSSGIPKGAMIQHRGMLNHLYAKVHALELTAADGLAQTASQCFDISVWQYLAALVVGGRVHIYPDEIAHDPRQLFEQVRADGVSILEVVPSLLRMLLDGMEVRNESSLALPALRWLMLTGEALPPELSRAWLKRHPSIPLINAYGPTECSDDVTHHPIRVPPAAGEVYTPIGRPIINTRLYVLDRYQQPVPAGVAGELYVGGVGVGRGYLNDPQRTNTAFLPDPFSAEVGARLYRTGDLCRLNPEGVLEFLGRVDDQVKVRGFRIELGEVESVLLGHGGVKEAVVVARQEKRGDKRLVGYVVPGREGWEGVEALKGYLKQKLPEYMVPSAFMVLEGLPLNANGKVDRKALPAVEVERQQAAYVAPRTPREQLVAQLWTELLGVERVGVEEDFFALGGHSLLATQVVARVRSRLGVELPLRAVFEAPTVAGLVKRIEQERGGGEKVEEVALRRVERQGRLPLSFAQQRLWFLDQLQPGSALYNVPGAVRMKGALHVEALEGGLEELVARHEALRMRFRAEEGVPYAVLAQPQPVGLERVSLEAVAPQEQQAQVHQWMKREAQRPFSLEHGPLLRGVLLVLGPQEHVLLLTMHHIVSDGWSVGVLVKELSRAYKARVEGREVELEPLPVQYVDYAAWQQEWMKGAALQKQLGYWRKQLEFVAPSLELPTDRPRPAVPSIQGGRCPVKLDKPLTQALGALSRQEGVTLFMTLLAGFQVLLYRYTGQGDIVVGSPIAGRTREEVEGLIGFFVNTLVLRTRVRGEESFRQVLGQVREVTLGAYAHQEVPFEKLVEQLQPERDLSRTPLFQVMFVLQNAPRQQLRLAELELEEVVVDSGTSKFDMTLQLEETQEGLEGALAYNSALFDRGTVERMVGHLRVLLEGVVAQADKPVRELGLLTTMERQQVLVEWNQTQADYPVECLHVVVEQQARRTPQAVAVSFERDRLTYQQLEERANRLAQRLRKLGVGPEVLVGLFLERSVELVVALLGVLKAGGAYVPLEPTYPKERLGFMLEDTQVPVLLTQRHLMQGLPAHQAQVLCLDEDWQSIAREPAEPPSSAVTPDNLAYVIYTSGSTGQPKGVMITHRAVGNFLLWSNRVFPLGHGDRVLQKTLSGFDASVWEFLAPLMAGAELVMARPDGHRDTGYLIQILEERRITHLKLVPSLLQALLEEPAFGRLSSLRHVFCGAEALPVELVRRFQERSPAALCNMYGPTEASIDASYFPITGEPSGAIVPIGRALDNVRLYVLDAARQPVPVGVQGELYIGGVGLARGYLNRPELTAERFVSASPGPQAERLYRTGDRVRWLPGGDIEFLGRLDHQLKIRGVRIEPGEIEAVLTQHPTVREAVVMAREVGSGDRRLVAYVTPRGDTAQAPGELMAYLRTRLPEVMVPSAIIPLPALPLNSSGKLDRNALPATEEVFSSREGLVGPRTPLEQQLVEIWQDLLGIQPIGMKDDFFMLGGHSMLAIRLMARIRNRLGRELPLMSLFRNSTIEQMAAVLQRPSEPVDSATLVSIQPEGSRMPFFCVHPVGGGVLCYAELAHALGREQPFHGLQNYSPATGSALPTSMEEMAAAYIEAIRSIQPRGPYLLGGWSMGGAVAFEMAHQLERRGEQVGLLALIDSHAPERVRASNSQNGLPPVARFALDFGALHGKNLSGWVDGLVQRDRQAQLSVLLATFKQHGSLPPEFSFAELEQLLATFEHNSAVLERYIPRGVAAPVALFRASEEEGSEHEASALGWGPHATGGIQRHVIPGNHFTLLTQPNVRLLAQVLRSCLVEATARTLVQSA
ncbi:non-ribosomal peptide synthetase [Cystobacter ferrugineus]|uniref:Carrier domain-containing protein n=1 Tax=Cystobacter ferrugineus TaxID=83449 RepID=A0A1L9AWK9_9BACT|nr:non-ribosomal peptide synthetase [Cystobacter ferrugineus]OJH34303.1 hypothetical protein BON30_44125 [Cystobacter ferrugineus]